MKRLILMRHAKSDWSGGATSDHKRILNTRGREGVAALGRWMRTEGLHPDEVLSSSAVRTQETLTRLNLPKSVATTLTPDLYLVPAKEIMNTLKGAKGNVVLVVGHNPGIGIFAGEILAKRPDHMSFERYPTCATLVADFDIADWNDAEWGKAHLVHFLVPRDL